MGERGTRDWRDTFANLSTWKRGNQRAVHKPLLTLLLLARAARGESARVDFASIEDPLRALLVEFGPPRKSHHPEYPFWHLQSDGFWALPDAGALPPRKGGGSPSVTTLRQAGACGVVDAELWEDLAQNPALIASLSQTLLDAFWPATLHASLQAAIGLPTEPVGEMSQVSRRRRDPAFREHVLRAYERCCAVCGYDGRIGASNFALDAAHIRWHAEGGSDDVDNGLALCSFHHVALDRGALGISEDQRVLISADVNGGGAVRELLISHHGQPLRRPQSDRQRPSMPSITWHQAEVFRRPARAA